MVFSLACLLVSYAHMTKVSDKNRFAHVGKKKRKKKKELYTAKVQCLEYGVSIVFNCGYH